MSSYVEHASRPGHTGLSLISLGGLSSLTGAIWHVAPGFVILLLMPALAMCAYQTVVSPIFGLRMGRDAWTVLDGPDDIEIPTAEIAFLRVIDHEGTIKVSIMLRSGDEVDVPLGRDQKPLDLIRNATDLGVPVRSA